MPRRKSFRGFYFVYAFVYTLFRMKSGKISSLLCFVLVVLSSPAYTFEVTDAYGRTLSFTSPPTKIVIAGRGVLMTADAVYLFPGAVERVAAVEKITQGAKNFIPIIDPRFNQKTILPVEVGAEEIAAVKPDLVLLKAYMRNKIGKPLERMGIPVFYCSFENPEEYLAEIEMLGRLMGDAPRGMRINLYYKNRLETVDKVVSMVPETEKPSVLFLSYTQKGGSVSFNVPPRSWLQSVLLELAGGRPVWDSGSARQGWQKVGFEQIAAWDPDYIFITSYFSNVEAVTGKLKRDPLWSSLKAVRQDRLKGFPGDFFSWDQPDTRWMLGFLWMAKQLYPDKFGTLDILEETRVFYREMYGIGRDLFSDEIVPLLRGDINKND